VGGWVMGGAWLGVCEMLGGFCVHNVRPESFWLPRAAI
jgi:hypothetical protein